MQAGFGDLRRGRATVVCGVLSLVAALAYVSIFATSRAQAAVTHAFLPEVSEALAGGVPVSATPQEATLTGPLESVKAMSGDSGHVWIADSMQGNRYRVDKFDANSGQFLPPQLGEEEGVSFFESGVAVGHVTGEEEAYVGAGREGEDVVAVFGPDGKLQAVWNGANTPNKSFSQSEGQRVGVLTGVAVDNSTGIETSGDVYVATFGEGAFNVVDVFRPVAGGAEPSEVVSQLTGTCETPGTSCSGGEVVPFSSPTGVAASGFNGDVFVTDRSKVIDIFEPTVLGQYVFVGQLTGTPTGPGGAEALFEEVAGVAVDGANGDIYVVDARANAVDQFDASGKYLGRLTGTPAGSFSSLLSVAVDPDTEHVFVRDFNPDVHASPVVAFGKSIVVPDVTTGAATAVTVSGDGHIEAILNGTVNPVGEGEATCQFVWGPTAAFGQIAPCEPQAVPNGEADVPVHATIKDLAPDTSYVFRLQASNAFGTNPGEASQNETLITPGPGLHGASVSDVTSDSATLRASIDPHGAPTSYYFQYGRSAQYEASVPAPPGIPLGSGEGDVSVAPQHLQGLEPNTLYHYRVVAVSVLEVEGAPTAVAFPGADRMFTTQAVGVASALPDARQWEQVSPSDKHGAFLQPIAETGVIQAAASGGAISYRGNVPTEEARAGNDEGVQIVSSRAPGGWLSQDIPLPHESAVGLSVGNGREYRFFSEDLALALVEPFGEEFTTLAPESAPPDTERTPYVRHNTSCVSVPATCFEPLLTSAPGYADVPEGTQFGGGQGQRGQAQFVGAAPDLAHVVIDSLVALTPTPISGEELYEWSADKPPSERLQLVSVLPGGEPSSTKAKLGFENQVARHAVSDDGSRIVWSEEGGHLYLRDAAKQKTLQLDVPDAKCLSEGECGGGEANPRFQLASRDGSRIFFTDPQRLTEGSASGSPDLYVCEVVEVAGEPACRLSDLTPPSRGEAANVVREVLGASDDGTWVYYVANGALADGATPGKCQELRTQLPGARCNVYVSHHDGAEWGAPALVAVIAGDDFDDWEGGVGLPRLTGRVSPDGHWLAFMSDLGLTGYDTTDAASEKPDEEVYLYHAEPEGPGRLVCASCNPSGARPRGVEYAKLNGKLVGGFAVWNDDQWIAANIPGWTPYMLSTALYQSRYLSDQGRLFFNSSDALVPRDVNHDEDVYEFEPAGVGDCSPAAPGFSAATGGCVGLISAGTASGESAFLDASQSGDDVFFLTSGQLVAGDSDTAIDVYDAHVCSPSAPCFNPPSHPPPCGSAEACRPTPTPQPSILGSPASSTFSGAGNVVPAAPKRTALTRTQKLRRALKACRKLKRKHRRVVCERRARKRYGAKKTNAVKSERSTR
jgi:hypothetical protein